MDPPENMVRCMANNYSPLGFWRSWHRSYNLWIVRYLYIPLGGTHRLAATSILIFTFVALWHDLSPRLLAWGWLAAIFILPEIVARRALPPSMVRAQPSQFLTMDPFLRGSVLCMQFGERWWYRHACAAGGVFNVLLMMGANLIGFVLGMDGAQYLAREVVSNWDGKSYSESIPRTSLIDVPTQVFVFSLSRVLVCSLACRSCLNTGMSVRL
jgi:D-alanyl-lipoteichoic acid acyltransferase DltB (MBOAT superfamily)